MNKKRTILGGAILVAVLMLGIGYAAISNITLTITGSATANPSQENFVVEFDTDKDSIAISNTQLVTAEVKDGDEATMTVTGFNAKGNTAYATFTVENNSPDLTANITLEPIVEGDTEDYFTIETEIDEPTVFAQTSTNVTVKVTLNKTPVNGEVNGTFDVKLKATPEQPTN